MTSPPDYLDYYPDGSLVPWSLSSHWSVDVVFMVIAVAAVLLIMRLGGHDDT